MKQNIIIGALLLILGLVSGLFICRSCAPETEIVQKDTVTVEKKVYYSKLDLESKTYRLEIPDVGLKEYVFFHVDSIIYKDKVIYATAERQYFFTKVDKAEIWHSGIDSRIDSLNVYTETTTITERIQPVTKRNSLEFGIETNYSTMFSIPLHLEYSRNVNDWLSVYGYGEYELLRKQFGVGAGTKIAFGW